MQIASRTESSKEYRYGFNGKEKEEDNEFGSLTHYDYGFRIYNPGIGRFLSVDPLNKSYPWYTPYQFAGNKPIAAVDLDGLEEQIRIYNNTENGKVMNTILDGKTLKMSTQISGSYAIYKDISQKEWILFKKGIWNGFSRNESYFSSGYNEYTMGMGGEDKGFYGLERGILTISAGSQTILKYDPTPVKRNDISFAKAFSRGAHAFNVFFFNPDPLVEGSQKSSQAFKNYVGMYAFAFGASSLYTTGITNGFLAGAEVSGEISYLDDLSGEFDANGQTILSKYSDSVNGHKTNHNGDKPAGIIKMTLSGLSTFGDLFSLKNPLTLFSLISDFISTHDNLKKAKESNRKSK